MTTADEKMVQEVIDVLENKRFENFYRHDDFLDPKVQEVIDALEPLDHDEVVLDDGRRGRVLYGYDFGKLLLVKIGEQYGRVAAARVVRAGVNVATFARS